MPIDPDAYMSGAIPALSRGGSWVPPVHPGHPANGTSGTYTNPLSTLLSSPLSGYGSGPASPTLPKSSSSALSDLTSPGPCPGPFVNPLYMPNGPFSFIADAHTPTNGLRPLSAYGPISHPGWSLNQIKAPSISGSRNEFLPSGAGAGSTIASSSRRTPSTVIPPTIRQATPTLTAPPSVIPHIPLPQGIANGGRYRDGMFLWDGGSWEKGAGAPKPMSRESGYSTPLRRQASIHPIRKKAESLPSAPPTPANSLMGTAQTSKSLRREEDRQRERTASGSGRQLAERRKAVEDRPRPGVMRSASEWSKRNREENYVQPTESAGSQSHSKKSSPAAAAAATPSPLYAKTMKTPSPSPYIKLTGRPPVIRRHTHHPQSTSTSSNLSPTSPPPVYGSHSPISSHAMTNRLRRVSQPTPRLSTSPLPTPSSSSTLSSMSSTSSPSSPLSSCLASPLALHSPQSNIVDFTTPNTPHSTGRPKFNRSKSHHDISDRTSLFSSRSGVRTRMDAPPGYISPISDDGYDRYSPHPAAPTPDRIERIERIERADCSAASTVAPVGFATTHDDSKQQDTSTSAETYLPIGFAGPTRPLEWNRDGPAMKTHGIAWKRHNDGLVLRPKPDGPRWVQARPPRVELVSGGGWWESGGQGS